MDLGLFSVVRIIPLDLPISVPNGPSSASLSSLASLEAVCHFFFFLGDGTVRLGVSVTVHAF